MAAQFPLGHGPHPALLTVLRTVVCRVRASLFYCAVIYSIVAVSVSPTRPTFTIVVLLKANAGRRWPLAVPPRGARGEGEQRGSRAGDDCLHAHHLVFLMCKDVASGRLWSAPRRLEVYANIRMTGLA